MDFLTGIFLFISELTKNEIFIQCFGFLGTACVVIGMQCKTYNKVLTAKCSNSLVAGLQYLMFGKYPAMTVSFV
ncbi:MAG: YgjV family protein, partial [Clostridia bacterium]|nr:YgjV family protein [Clostridia bacterium]